MAKTIADQFKGLPIGELISKPLIAAAQAQGQLAGITEQFIEEVGLESGVSGLQARQVKFNYDTPVEYKSGIDDPAGATGAQGQTLQVEQTFTKIETRSLNVPLLAIVNTPNLSVKDVTIDFDMKVQSSTEHNDSVTANIATKASYSAWWSPVKCSMTASVGSKSSNTRKTDNSARYTVHCEARDDGAPEGLMKVLDILGEAIKPVTPS